MWLDTLLDQLDAAADATAVANAVFGALPRCPAGLLPLRALLHLGRAERHVGLWKHEWRTARSQAPLGVTASALRWAQLHPEGVVLDIEGRTALPVRGAAAPLPVPDAMSEGSARLLSERDAAWVIVVGVSVGAELVCLTVELSGRTAPPVDHVVELRRLLRVAAPALLSRPDPPPTEDFADPHLPVVGARMARELRTLSALARYGDSILLLGPPGVGKSRLAEWIHARSPNGSEAPFVEAQLAHTPAALLAAELYGARRGAFTDAHEDRPGKLQLAADGTLFVDELAEVELAAQATLLDLCQKRPYRPLGDSGPARTPRVRLLFATNADLSARVAEGRFRPDLHDRVRGFVFEVPALGERRDEIPGWVAWFLAARCRTLGVPALTVDPALLAAWEAAPWPGNLRELEQAVTRSVALALARGGRTLTPEDAQLSPVAANGVVAALETAARTFVDAAPGVGLRPKDAEILRAYVLERAVEVAGSPKAGFLRLGEEALVDSNNHTQELARQRERRAAFELRVGRR